MCDVPGLVSRRVDDGSFCRIFIFFFFFLVSLRGRNVDSMVLQRWEEGLVKDFEERGEEGKMKCFGESQSLRDVSIFGVSKVDRNFARGGEMWIGFLDRRALLDV